MFNSLMLFLSPALLSLALAIDVATPVTPIDDVVKQLLNLGVGGVIAAVFFFQWRRVESLWLDTLERERKLLLKIAEIKIEDDSGGGD